MWRRSSGGEGEASGGTYAGGGKRVASRSLFVALILSAADIAVVTRLPLTLSFLRLDDIGG